MLKPEDLCLRLVPKGHGESRTVYDLVDPGHKDDIRRRLSKRFREFRHDDLPFLIRRGSKSAAIFCFDVADCYNRLVYDLENEASLVSLVKSAAELDPRGFPVDPDLPVAQMAETFLGAFHRFLLPHETRPGCYRAPAGIPSSPLMARIALAGALKETEDEIAAILEASSGISPQDPSFELHLYADNIFVMIRPGPWGNWWNQRGALGRLEYLFDRHLEGRLGTTLNRKKTRLIRMAPMRRAAPRLFLGIRYSEMGAVTIPRPVLARLRTRTHRMATEVLDMAGDHGPGPVVARLERLALAGTRVGAGPKWVRRLGGLTARVLHYLNLCKVKSGHHPTLLGLLARLSLLRRLTVAAPLPSHMPAFPGRPCVKRLKLFSGIGLRPGWGDGTDLPPALARKDDHTRHLLSLAFPEDARRVPEAVFSVPVPLPRPVFRPIPFPILRDGMKGLPEARASALLELLPPQAGLWPKSPVEKKCLVAAAFLRTGPGFEDETPASLPKKIRRFLRASAGTFKADGEELTTRGFSTAKLRYFLVPFIFHHRVQDPKLLRNLFLLRSKTGNLLRLRLLGPVEPKAWVAWVDRVAQRRPAFWGPPFPWGKLLHLPDLVDKAVTQRGGDMRVISTLDPENRILHRFMKDLLAGNLDGVLVPLRKSLESVQDSIQLWCARAYLGHGPGGCRALERWYKCSGVFPNGEILGELSKVLSDLSHRTGEAFEHVLRFAVEGGALTLDKARHPAWVQGQGMVSTVQDARGFPTDQDSRLQHRNEQWRLLMGLEPQPALARLHRAADRLVSVWPGGAAPLGDWLSALKQAGLDRKAVFHQVLLLVRKLRHAPGIGSDKDFMAEAATFLTVWRVCESVRPRREDAFLLTPSNVDPWRVPVENADLSVLMESTEADLVPHLEIRLRKDFPEHAPRLGDYRPFLTRLLKQSPFRRRDRSTGARADRLELRLDAELSAVIHHNQDSTDCSFHLGPGWYRGGCFSTLAVQNRKGTLLGNVYLLASPFEGRYDLEVFRDMDRRPFSFVVIDKIQLATWSPGPDLFDALCAHPALASFDLILGPKSGISNYAAVERAWLSWISRLPLTREVLHHRRNQDPEMKGTWLGHSSTFENASFLTNRGEENRLLAIAGRHLGARAFWTGAAGAFQLGEKVEGGA